MLLHRNFLSIKLVSFHHEWVFEVSILKQNIILEDGKMSQADWLDPPIPS